MKFHVEVVCVSDDGDQRRSDIMELERADLAMETLGLNLAEAKSLLEGVQDFITSMQVAEDLARRRACSSCGERHTSKDGGTTEVKTLFGSVTVANPRWNRCSCRRDGAKTFRPVAAWLSGRTSPELVYLETKWGSLLPYGKVASLLKEVLPIDDQENQEAVRRHLHATAQRLEDELGEERPSLVDVTDENLEELPTPDGPMTVGIDGGYVRAAHKQGFFEVMAGRSVVAFRRDGDDAPSAKCFGFVQTYDEKPRRRLWELMKSQGMQANQAVQFLSDGGDDVRKLQQRLHPLGEHRLDWFHVTMRLTVLQQQTKAVKTELPARGTDASSRLESIKHLLWHGNVDEALERIGDLLMDLEEIRSFSVPAGKLQKGLTEFETYISNNRGFISNFGELYRQGETISTAFVESTINQVVSRRFVKKQQMHWTPRGAHLLLQTRTAALNGELDEIFRRWYPRFRAQAKSRPDPIPSEAQAA